MNNRREFLKKSIIFGVFSIFAPKILTNCFPVRQTEQEAFARYIGPIIKETMWTWREYPLPLICNWEDNDAGLSIPMDLDFAWRKR